MSEQATVKRFYLTLILYKLLKEHTVWEVASVFKVTRGFVQNLLTSASSFASCMVHFTGVSTRLKIKYTQERVSGLEPKPIIWARHKGHWQSSEQIKTRRNYT